MKTFSANAPRARTRGKYTVSCKFSPIVETQGQLIPVQNLHPPIANGTRGEKLHHIGKAVGCFHYCVELHISAYQFTCPIHEKATEHNTRRDESMKSFYLLKKAFNRLPANHPRSNHKPYFNTEKVLVLMARLQGKGLYGSSRKDYVQDKNLKFSFIVLVFFL